LVGPFFLAIYIRMPTINYSVTQSIDTLAVNLSASEALVMNINNPLIGASYFGLETIPDNNGVYTSTAPKNTSGSFTLGTGIIGLIKDDYKMSAVVSPGNNVLTFSPAAAVTGSTLWTRGISSPPLSTGIDAQAQAHYDRVIADGGVVPAGISGTNAFFNAVKSIYGTSDITTAVSVGVDAHYLGYKLGAGAGATSGQAVQKLYSCAGSSGDVVQTTAASQPLLLAHNGASSDNYWFSSGAHGNAMSTPDAAANRITGNIEIVVSIGANRASGTNYILKKQSSSSIDTSYLVLYSSAGSVSFVYTTDGVYANRITVTSTVGLSAGHQFLKITRNASSGDVYFYTKVNEADNWVQLGLVRTSTPSAIFTGTGFPVNISDASNNGFTAQFSCYYASISNNISATPLTTNATPVVEFNPSQYNASTSQTQWTSTTGEVWTINTGTASTGYKGVLVDRTIVQADGVDDRLTSGTLTLNQPLSTYSAVKGYDLITKTFWDGFTTTNRMTLIDRKFSAGLGIQSYAGASAYITTNIINLNLITWVINGSSSSFGANNNLSAVASGTSTNDSLQLFGGSNGFGNNLINTIIQAKTNDNTATKTAMYNYIRSINNNAF
jgi:hypothetical protein